MDAKQETLSIIKSTSRKYFSDAEVLLFGSRARSESNSKSDFDILLITSKELAPNEKMPYKTKIRKELLGKGIRSDILIQSKNEVEKKKYLPGHMIRNILDEAIPL